MARRLFLAALCLCLALPLSAQWSNQKKKKNRDPNVRNLEGVVTLPDGNPAKGAVVKIKNLKTLQVTSFITPVDGKYRFHNLSSNIDYEVRADFNDLSSDKRMLSVFDSRLDAVINLPLAATTNDKDKEKERSQ
ncbi:MAG TPA: carboxypeptidase-like regulatory domain-containing protein [Bryobacteraceae bacterium]|nr:carboxypeptidase-like regulatory domain-containing protein [Bryobacteraceae bacterium]HPT27941.1 carboxypeptidase-like regulatory domain-containing protein [Bryobacteraceae bacterium]